MSKKKYKVTRISDTKILLEEEQPYSEEVYGYSEYDIEHSTSRELKGYKMREMPKGKKIFWILFFNLYGFWYRWGSNSGLAVFFSCVHFFAGAWLSISMISRLFEFEFSIPALINDISNSPFTIVLLIALTTLLLIDFLSVAIGNDIYFIGNKKYKDFEG